ncbi:MAG TPA: PAS domain S-box protein [Verrucomicrobiae bacterium]
MEKSKKKAVNPAAEARESPEGVRRASEQGLGAFNQQISSILERISDGFVALDTGWRFIYLNRKGEEIFRRLQKIQTSLLGKVLWDEFPEIRSTEIEQHYRRAVADQVTVEFEAYLEPLDAWFVVRAYPSSDGISIYLLDISRRKKSEAARNKSESALRASEQHFRAAFNQAAVGMAVANLQGRFEAVNDRFSEMLRYSREELLTQGFADITHPADLAATAENVRRLMSGEVKDFIYEKRFLRRDGSILWARTSVTLLVDDEGKPDRFIGVIDDITERKLTEERLRQGTERLQLALDAGQLGDWSWNAATDVVTVGAATADIFGLPRNTAITWAKMRELIHEDDREKDRLAVEKALVTHTDYDLEYRVLRGADCRWIAARGRGVYSADGAVLGMIGVLQDVSERRTAEQLRSRLAAVVESSDDAIISMNLDTVITTWNKGAEKMFGYSAEETVGQSINKLLPSDRQHEEGIIIGRIVNGEQVEHYETIRTRKDGKLLDVSLSVSPIYDAQRQIVGVSKISRDVTHRKQAEEALRRSEEDLRALADSISQLAWMARPDGHIFWYNRRWYDYTGKTPEQMEGWGWQSVHDPEILPSVVERWKEAIRTGTPFEMEFPLRGGDGVFRWFLTLVNPLRDIAGNVVRWFGTNTDVDEVRRVQKALEDQSQVLEVLNETGQAIASQLDLNTVVQIVTDSSTRLSGAKFGAFFYNVIDKNGEAFMLYTLSGAPREAFEKFGHPRATPMFGPTFRGEGVVRIADVTKDPRYGQWGPHHGMPKGHLPVRSYLAVPVISRNGKVIGGLFFGHPDVGVFTERAERLVSGVAAQAAIAIDNARLYDAAQHEIGQRKKVEAELRAAQEKLQSHAIDLETQVAERTAKLRETIGELEAFSYSVSHDMRSPLRAMQGYSDALLEDYAEKVDDTGRDYLNRIKRAASRMDLLIQDVLAYSRVAQGDVPLKPVDLENVIRDVIQSYPTLQPECAKISILTALPRVIGHEAYLTQAISNILTNGVKFVAPGTFPALEVGAQLEGECVRVYFKDNGIGIAPEHRDRIFQIFGRVYSDKQFEGTGIGLAIAKKAAERVGGSIGVTSELGKGSTFYLLLKPAT